MVASMPRRKQPPEKPPHPLRQWRDARGLSQEDLAAATGHSQGMISHIEQYLRVPRGQVLLDLLDHTGLPAEAFIRPERFLADHPRFFQTRRRGRPPKG
jgi:transcriptional regulator with XRE-family HTH domain